MPERPSKGAHYDLGNIEYRLDQLESRAERNERVFEERRNATDETFRRLERDLQAAVHESRQADRQTDKRVDILVAKLSVWATVCGAIGWALMQVVMGRLVK